MSLKSVNPEEIHEQMGLSLKEMEKQIARFEKVVGRENIINKRVLEIGAGSGAFSCLMALYGASSVTAIEPEADGCTNGSLKVFEERKNAFNFNNCYMFPKTLQEYESEEEAFDVIVAVASINHWNEECCVKLHEDASAENEYTTLFKKCYKYLKSDGKLILSDVARTNFFGKLKSLTGLKHPFAPSIEWHKHQDPKIWKQILIKSGFKGTQHKWVCPPPKRFGLDKLINNYIAAYLTASYFVITASK